MGTFFEWLFSVKGQIALAGALGGVVRWLTLRQMWREGLASILVGGICAVYLGPLASPVLDNIVGIFNVAPDARASFSGFVIGVGGIAVAGAIMDFWRARKARSKESGND